MNKQKFAVLFLCFFAQQPIVAGEEKTLFFTVNSQQEQIIFLQCNVYYPTGEKEAGFDWSVMPGKSQRFASQNLKNNCKATAIVKCKLRKTSKGYGVAHIGVIIPCAKIKSSDVLELEISKENGLMGAYAHPV